MHACFQLHTCRIEGTGLRLYFVKARALVATSPINLSSTFLEGLKEEANALLNQVYCYVLPSIAKQNKTSSPFHQIHFNFTWRSLLTCFVFLMAQDKTKYLHQVNRLNLKFSSDAKAVSGKLTNILRESISSSSNIQPGNFSAPVKAEFEASRSNKATREPVENIGEDNNIPIMRHRLRKCLPFWSTFCKSTLVLSWIAMGFDLRWKDGISPKSNFFSNHKSAFENEDFVSVSIDKLLKAGSMKQVMVQPFLVSPLGVVFKKSNGKPRLFCDLRYLNEHLIIPDFKYEDLGVCAKVIQPNDFMVATDYTSGFHHVDIHEDFTQYFGVEWKGKFYVYTSMPFGLATAPWAFTKIVRELANMWRKEGHRNSIYLDDALHLDQSYSRLKAFVQNKLIPDTEKAGFLINFIKSILEPSTRQIFLGVFVNSIRGCYEIPEERKQKIISLIQKALENRKHCSVKILECITGHLASCHWAFGPLSRLMTMSLYADMNKVANNNNPIPLSEISVQDLNFWLCGFDRYNGFKPLWEPTGFHTTIYTDAAGISLQNYGGWAGWMDSGSGHRLIAKGIWSGDICFDHSTSQELFAVYNTILSFNQNSMLRDKRVLLKTDNQAIFFIINKAGSRVEHVHELCKKLHWYCIFNRISLVAEWIPRDKNTYADFFSKFNDSGDWKLNPKFFTALNNLWGPFHVDLFASYDNHQVHKYYSRFFTPDCAGVDAFEFHWGNQNCWCYPPFSLIGRVIAKGMECKAKLCLICPFTPSAIWWPFLINQMNEQLFAPFVHGVRVLYKQPDLLLPGSMAHTYTGRTPRWDFLALQLDFSDGMNAQSFRIPPIK